LNILKQSPVSYETIVRIIANLKGPSDQIKKYLLLMDDVEHRQVLAFRYKQTDVIIEVIIFLLEMNSKLKKNLKSFSIF
jgi:hypothetical protein